MSYFINRLIPIIGHCTSFSSKIGACKLDYSGLLKSKQTIVTNFWVQLKYVIKTKFIFGHIFIFRLQSCTPNSTSELAIQKSLIHCWDDVGGAEMRNNKTGFLPHFCTFCKISFVTHHQSNPYPNLVYHYSHWLTANAGFLAYINGTCVTTMH